MATLRTLEVIFRCHTCIFVSHFAVILEWKDEFEAFAGVLLEVRSGYFDTPVN